MTKILNWLLEARWWFIGLAAFLLFSLELYETPIGHIDPIHIIETLIYFGFLLIVGVLLELLIRANRYQAHIMRILNYKHTLSLDLSNQSDWDSLIERVTLIPGLLADVDLTCLYVRNPVSGRMEGVASRRGDTYSRNTLKEFEQVDLTETGRNSELFGVQGRAGAHQYCLPLNYGTKLMAVLCFQMKAGRQLSTEQTDLFNNISSEIALEIKASQERKIFSEMRITEATLADRRSVSHYLHDNLSQNLAYLRLSLEQFLFDSQDALPKARHKLEQMLDAANNSYEIVRNTLETMHPETSPGLHNLLLEHGRKVSQRAHFEVIIHNVGAPVSLHPDTQRAVFYVYQEALTNIEKHAWATQVDVLLTWTPDLLEIKISDNGVGFNLDTVMSKKNKHFGLEIMQERVANVNGRVDLMSIENKGTTVTITLPLAASIQKELAFHGQ